MAPAQEHTVAVVVPVYRGEDVLDALVTELAPLTKGGVTPEGHPWRLVELVLVRDPGPDRSDKVIRRLAADHHFIIPVWLARNFGQHPATLAGMASTSAEWVVTMDEDGQQDPGDIPKLLDTAMKAQVPLVYAAPGALPHGFLRNQGSLLTKRFAEAVLGVPRFNSFRLVLGEIARGLAAYCGEGVFLDVGLTWVVSRVAHCPVSLRQERSRPSGYSYRRLARHFWGLVLTSGTRPLRLIAALGAAFALASVVLVGWVIWASITQRVPVPGWSSVMVVLLAASGALLFALGVIAEYLGIAVKMAMGKPPYLIVSDPARGPLGRTP